MHRRMIVLQADGGVTETDLSSAPSMDALRDLVGGFVEIRPVIYQGSKVPMILDEDGKLKESCRPNYAATRIVRESAEALGYHPSDYVVGTAVLLQGIQLSEIG